jgi:hypothetical protein
MLNDPKPLHVTEPALSRARVALGSLAVCCYVAGSGLARADEGERGPRHEPPVREMQRDQRVQRPAEPPRAAEAPRQIDPRSYEARAEEQRRAMQESSRNAEMNRRVGRLTPDERRDLRRQINEVGQDLYALPPRH